MSEAFYNKERDLKNKISLNGGGSTKLIDINEYINNLYKQFKKIIDEVNNENDVKLLFLDFLEVKNNIDEVYMPSDMDEYTLDKMNEAQNVLTDIYALLLTKEPTIYTSQIQYFAYSSLFEKKDCMLFYKYLFEKIKDNYEVAKYTVGVFREIIFVHYDLDINNVIIDNIVELIEYLKKLCDDAMLDANIELEGLIN